MSMSGRRRLELERQRLEQLRLNQVRAECTALLDRCDERIREVRDVATQQLAAAELRACVDELAEVRATVEASPDQALAASRGVTDRIETVLATAQQRAGAWSERQVQAAANTRASVRQVEAALVAAGKSEGAEAARRQAAKAGRLADEGRVEEAANAAAKAWELAGSALDASLAEKARKEAVRGLIATLKGMGFVVPGPRLVEGRVVLAGRLASGRLARFEVAVDGEMEFDLDGYEGRACAEDMEKVETTLRDKFGVQLGPPQVVWKNPDRRSKGARDLPPGGASGGGKR